ncbi:MAG TPA: hypothetical protein VKA38_13940, partial [Draconibacterium sp.]|nr:hypothetical protein [Draconibacterium sp.]
MKLFPFKNRIPLFIVFIFLTQSGFAQLKIEAGDPPNNTDIPSFFKSKLSDIQLEIDNVNTGKVKTIATSP